MLETLLAGGPFAPAGLADDAAGGADASGAAVAEAVGGGATTGEGGGADATTTAAEGGAVGSGAVALGAVGAAGLEHATTETMTRASEAMRMSREPLPQVEKKGAPHESTRLPGRIPSPPEARSGGAASTDWGETSAAKPRVEGATAFAFNCLKTAPSRCSR